MAPQRAQHRPQGTRKVVDNGGSFRLSKSRFGEELDLNPEWIGLADMNFGWIGLAKI